MTGCFLHTSLTPALNRKIAAAAKRMESNIRITYVSGMLAYTPPVQKTMRPGQAPDISQRPVRNLRKFIAQQILGEPGNEFNWAYVGADGRPYRTKYGSSLALTIPFPGQKRRPDKVVDALDWITRNTDLKYSPKYGVYRHVRPSADTQVWTTRTSWRAAARTLSLRAGNFLSGWTKAGEWAAELGGRNPLKKVLPSNGSWGCRGGVWGSVSAKSVYLENAEAPPGLDRYVQDIFDSKMEHELDRAIKLHEKYFFDYVTRLLTAPAPARPAAAA